MFCILNYYFNDIIIVIMIAKIKNEIIRMIRKLDMDSIKYKLYLYYL